jgi:hypothetical protein
MNEEGRGFGFEGLGVSAERDVKKHYGTEIIESEEIAVDVSGVKVSTITWRPEYVWRCGVVRVPSWKPIPYEARVAVNLLVDVTRDNEQGVR